MTGEMKMKPVKSLMMGLALASLITVSGCGPKKPAEEPKPTETPTAAPTEAPKEEVKIEYAELPEGEPIIDEPLAVE